MLQVGSEPIPGYRLERFLGKGQFGEVWKARSPGQAHVALKFLDLGAQCGWKEFRSIQRVKQVRHPHLLPIIALWLLDEHGRILEDSEFTEQTSSRTGTLHPTGNDSQRPRYLVVETLLADGSLADRLDACRSEGHAGIPLDELLEYMEEAAKGIDYLNTVRLPADPQGTGFQHCDIKPANIMLVGNSVMVGDFGLAQLMAGSRSAATATNMIGSPAYMAPEAADRKPSSTTDQYSLAITYLELRTGELPFVSQTYLDVLNAHRKGDLDLSRLPLLEQHVIRRATARDPRQRFGSNRELVARLKEAAMSAAVTPQRRRIRTVHGIVAAVLVISSAFAARTIYVKPAVEQRGSGLTTRTTLPGGARSHVSDDTIKKPQRFTPVTRDREVAGPDALPAAPFDGAREQRRYAESVGLANAVTNSIGMKLVLIPPHEAVIGVDGEDGAAHIPRHAIRISHPFYMGVHEVTVGQFRQFVSASGYQTDAEKGTGWADGNPPRAGRSYNWRNPGFDQDDGEPVVNVSWNDARAFCDWLSRTEQKRYDLPSEIEWECAARAGSDTRFWCGVQAKSLEGVANLFDLARRGAVPSGSACAPWDDGAIRTAAVGSYRANAFGIFDIYGNVREWCSDTYTPGPDGNAKDDGGDADHGSEQLFAVRGLSFNDSATERNGTTSWPDRSLQRADTRYFDMGFRVVARLH